ncbi:MAG: hypothetical protein WBA07_33285 [Rivularia sp. (in: cyanobacteria)]
MIVNQTLNIIVIRVKDLEISKRFYETLGINFAYEQHLCAVLE